MPGQVKQLYYIKKVMKKILAPAPVFNMLFLSMWLMIHSCFVAYSPQNSKQKTTSQKESSLYILLHFIDDYSRKNWIFVLFEVLYYLNIFIIKLLKW